MGLFDNNAVVRWAVRKGTEDQRVTYGGGFLQGELVYTTDNKRLYIGTGSGNNDTVPVSPKLYASGEALLHPGDYSIDEASNSLTIKTLDSRTFTLSSGPVADGKTIVVSGGRLVARSILVNDKWFEIRDDGLALKPSIEVSQITAPRNSTLQFPATVDFGSLSIAFSDSSIENAPLTFGLRKDGEGKYSAFVVNMPQGGGGGGEGAHYSFSTNFKTVTSTGLVQVDLSGDLNGVASIGSADGTKLLLTGLRGGLSADYGLGVHVNDDNSLTIVKTEGGGQSGGGSVVLLDNPPFLCWNGNTKGNPDVQLSANMEFTISPYVFCNRKRMYISGRIPVLDEGESFESASYAEKLELETGSRPFAYDYWNNSMLALGRNNYKNLVNGQTASVEDEDGTIRQKCFTALNQGVLNAQLFEQEEIAAGTSGSETGVEPYTVPIELLRTSKRAGVSKIYARQSASTYSEDTALLQSVSVDGQDIPVSDLTGPDGVVSLDTSNPLCAGGWKVLYNNPAVTIDLHRATSVMSGKRTMQVEIPEGTELFRYDSERGKLLHASPGTLNAASFNSGDIIVARTAGGTPVFSKISTSRDYNLAATSNSRESRDSSENLTYDIVSYKKAFMLSEGKLKPRDQVEMPVDADERFTQPISWTLQKTSTDGTARVENPRVKTTVPATAKCSVVVAASLDALEELGYAKGAAPGEYWEETAQLTQSPAACVKLYNTALRRPAYADSVESLHLMKKPTTVLKKSAVDGSYEVLYDAAHGSKKLSLNTAALQYIEGDQRYGLDFAVLAYVPLKDDGTIDKDRISEARLEKADNTGPVLLGYDFTTENTNDASIITVEKANFFVDVFSENSQLSIGEDDGAPSDCLDGDIVCVHSLAQADYAEQEFNIDKVYLKRCHDMQYPTHAPEEDTRYTLKATKTGQVVDRNSGYSVLQYQVSEGLFLEDETVTQPGKLTKAKVNSTIKSVTLDETVPAETRTYLPSGVQSVFVEVMNNLASTSAGYSRAVLYADSFKGLAKFDPVDFGGGNWNWYDLAPEGTTPYNKSGSSTSSYSYTAPQAYRKADASSSKEKPVAPQNGETLGYYGFTKGAEVLEIPVVDDKFFLRVAGNFRSSVYGEFAVRLVGYRKK